MGIACSKPNASHNEPEPRPVGRDQWGAVRFRLYKEVYPALSDEDCSWMKRTKGALVVTGDDGKDIESLNAKVHRFKTEEGLQKFIKDRVATNTEVIRWYNVYAVPELDNV